MNHAIGSLTHLADVLDEVQIQYIFNLFYVENNENINSIWCFHA